MAINRISEDVIPRFLDTNGDGTGTKQVTGDYSSVADIFYIQPPATETFIVARMIVSIEDTNGFQAEEYGNLGAALTNGLILRVQDDSGTVLNITDDIPIKTNAHWGRFCYDVDVKSWGAGNELLVSRWTFANFGVSGLILRGSRSERLELVANDNFTGLLSHTFYVNGYYKS